MELSKYIVGALTVALLISLGFNVRPDDNYICRELMITNYCDRLSSTGLTCYPLPATTTGKKYCSSGWEEILQEVQPAATIYDEANIGAKYLCSVDGCVRIK